jgi:glutamine synthetase
VSLPNTVLSAAVADSLDHLVGEINVEKERGNELNKAIFKVLKTAIKKSDKVLFEGNNYSPEWEEEAKKRGLPNIKRTAYALDALVAEKNVSMFSRQKIFSSEELKARYHTKLEQYITTLEIEAETLVDIIRTKVIPAAVDYENKLCKAINGLNTILTKEAAKTELTLLEEVSKTKQELFEALQSLSIELEKAKSIEDIADKAKYFADHIVDLLEKARKPADILENLIEDAVWPLPKYSEMLFIM